MKDSSDSFLASTSPPQWWARGCAGLLVSVLVACQGAGSREAAKQLDNPPTLSNTMPSASATQFLDAQLSLQELSFTYEALTQVLPMYADTPSVQIQGAVGEALETVRAMVSQPNNTRLVQWLGECSAAVKSEADLSAFLDHFMAVLRQYTVILAAASHPTRR
jgi:hypothetical protein